MEWNPSPRVAYVVKRYPRFSETFITNEILAHEAAGLDVRIFALGFGMDERFQPSLADVKAPVSYIGGASAKSASELWSALGSVLRLVEKPGVLERLVESDPRMAVAACRLANAVLTQGITHLHAHFATSATTVARLASLMTGVPYSFTAHAKDIYQPGPENDDFDEKVRDASTVITVSEFNLRHLNDRYGHRETPIIRVYNGLPLDAFRYQQPTHRERRIVSVGRLVEKKGFRYLIDACAILRDRGLDFVCDIVGGGELEAELSAQIRKMGLELHVLLHGPRPQQDVKRLVSNAAVFAAPCVVGYDGNRDGLPTVLLEAMALGTPCIGTDVTGIPEVIVDGHTGYMVPQRDAEALADALEILLEDSRTRALLADRARGLIETWFDSARSAAEIRSHFIHQSVEVAA